MINKSEEESPERENYELCWIKFSFPFIRMIIQGSIKANLIACYYFAA